MESQPTTDDDIVRANYGDPRLRGVCRVGGGLFFSLDYTAAAVAEMSQAVTPRTEFSNLPQPLRPISAALARELGIDR